MNDIGKVSQMEIFRGSSRQLRRNGRSDYKKSDYWRRSAPARKRVWSQCLIICSVAALVAFLLSHGGGSLSERFYVTGLITLVFAMGCACVLIIMYKNDMNACRSQISEWDSVRVGIGPKSMTVEHTSWRDSMGQYLGDIEPILRGYKPIYQSNIPYNGIKQIFLCRPRKLLVVQASGTDTILRKDGCIVKTVSFYEGSSFPTRWVNIPLVFDDNHNFLKTVTSKTTIPIQEVESLDEPVDNQQ